MNDLALFKQKLSMVLITPVFAVGYAIPAVLANGQLFTPKENIQFNVFAFAFIVPRISAMLQHCLPPVLNVSDVSANCF